MNKKGVGLAELLAVVVVMGIIATISIPLVGRVIDKAKEKKIYGDAIAISEATRLYCTTIDHKTDFCQGKSEEVDSALDKYISGGYKAVSFKTRRVEDKLFYVKPSGTGLYYVITSSNNYSYKGDPLIQGLVEGCSVSKNEDVFSLDIAKMSYQDLVSQVELCIQNDEKPKPDKDVQDIIKDIEKDNDNLASDAPRFEVELDSNGNISNVIIKPKVDNGNIKEAQVTVDHIRNNPGLQLVPNIKFGESIELDDNEEEKEACDINYNGEGMFKNFTNLELIDFGEAEVEEPKDHNLLINVKEMFMGCTKLETVVNLPELDDDNATNATSMFENCISLKNVNLVKQGEDDITGITIADKMFKNCNSLKYIDLSYLAYVTTANEMFSGCTSLEELDLSSFTKLNVNNTNNMLKNTVNLRRITIPANFSLANTGLNLANNNWYYKVGTHDIKVNSLSEMESSGKTRTFFIK